MGFENQGGSELLVRFHQSWSADILSPPMGTACIVAVIKLQSKLLYEH